MKIEKFNEAKVADDFIGITSEVVQVKVIFKVNKSSTSSNNVSFHPVTDGNYSLRAKIEGINQIEFNNFEFGYSRSGEYLLLGKDLTKEQVHKKREDFLSHFSILHKNSNKYNL